MIDLDKDFEQILNDLNFSNAAANSVAGQSVVGNSAAPNYPALNSAITIKKLKEGSAEQTRLLKSLTFEEVKVPSCMEVEQSQPVCTVEAHLDLPRQLEAMQV
mmetsp:Transcript_3772/g.5700  ORF Transcript_3772/g.5700 Transcript_3772/m.5700 type:complete len:103 (+) Transcript_3772:385-693(+)